MLGCKGSLTLDGAGMSSSKQKYSIPKHVFPGSGTIAALQLLKFWMRPTLTPGV